LNRKDYIEWIIGQIRVSKGQNSESVVLADDDWQNIYNISLEEGVAPYLYYCINKSESELIIPESIKNKFIKISQNVLARNTRLYHELSKVLRLFSENGITVIVLKGAYLSEKVYPHNGLRPMGDIDLLVKIKDIPKVQELLFEIGFSQAEHFSIKEQCEKSHHLIPFINRNGIMIEIHWKLSRHLQSTSQFGIDGLWKRSVELSLATNAKTLTLSLEDHLLHLCIHTSIHHFFILWLKSFCDIALMIQYFQEEIDWEKFKRHARKWKVDRSLYLTLRFVEELLESGSPKTVLAALKPNDFNPQVISWVSHILISERKIGQELDQYHVYILNKKGTEIKGVLDIFKIVFPAKSIIAAKYKINQDSQKVYLYYFVRLINLGFQYSRSLFRLLRFETKINSSLKQATQKEMLKNWMKAPHV